MDIVCAGPGPHAPADGILGESDVEELEMLCAPCSAAAQATADDTPQTQLVTVQVDPDALSAIIASGQKATTVAALRTAFVALGQQLQS